MKKNGSLLLAISLVGLILALFPVTAHAGRCSVACTSTASCDLSCNAGTAREPDFITCGDWGVCSNLPPPPPPTCTSNWVITSSTASGGFAVQSFFPSGCDYYGVTRYTSHDLNGCKPDKVSCSITFHTFRSDLQCCLYYWCGGDTCGIH